MSTKKDRNEESEYGSTREHLKRLEALIKHNVYAGHVIVNPLQMYEQFL